MEKEEPRISIGVPVYNGEKYLENTLNSILSQTYQNFEVIISDNASTDLTPNICKEFAQRDKRIQYFRQEKNLGVHPNYKFVLDKAKNEFFMWNAVDDIRAPKFLEKNLNALLLNKNVVCSISKIKITNKRKVSTTKEFLRKIRYTFEKPRDIYPISGSYDNKVKNLLKKSDARVLYGLIRTDALRKSMVPESFAANDWAIILNFLRYGDLYVVDEVLMNVHGGGMSGKQLTGYAKLLNKNKTGVLFPFLPLTRWCFKNLGPKIFLKNLGWFIDVNLWAQYSIFNDYIKSTLKV